MLPARIPGYQPRLLDELGAMGEVGWVGRGSLGRDDGRIALVPARPRGAPAGRAGRRRGPPRDEPRHERDPRAPRRARRLVLPRAASRRPAAASDREVLDALWDLVWAGEVTNDTFAPLRALRWKRTGSRRAGGRRPRPGRLTALGPPEAAGRWSLVEPSRRASTDRTERLHAQALALLERHGVADPRGGRGRGHRGRLRRPSTRSCGRWRRPAGSGAATSSMGSGAAQFALAGALDRLRAVRDGAEPPGDRRRSTSSPPPTRPTRTAPRCRGRAAARTTGGRSSARPGAYVVLVDGVAALYLERGGATLQTLPAADDPAVAVAAVRALGGARRRRPDPRARRPQGRRRAGRRRRRSATRCSRPGFVAGYRGLVLRAALDR